MRRGEVKLVVGRYQQEFTQRQSEGNECLSPNLCLCSQRATLVKDIIPKLSAKRKTELGSDRVTKRKGTRAGEKKWWSFCHFLCLPWDRPLGLYVALFFFSHTLLFCVCATQESLLFTVKICRCFLPPPPRLHPLSLPSPSPCLGLYFSGQSVSDEFCCAVWTLITYQAFSRLSISHLFFQSLLTHTSQL